MFSDDLTATASLEEEHVKMLYEILLLLEKHGVRGKFSKCKFMQISVDYLGHFNDKDVIHTTEEKVAAITN